MEKRGHNLTRLEYKILSDLLQIETQLGFSGKVILLNLQVSGGMDSMCLLHVLSKVLSSKYFNSKNSFKLIAQHFNHKKRGEESDKDAELICKVCLKTGIPFYQEIADEETFTKEGNNFQNSARKWRKNKAHLLSEKMKIELNCVQYFIVTAHHARDHVETVLLHVLRGSALQGLKGIQKFSDDKIYYRPFCKFNYEEIENYSNEFKIEYRTDLSNFNNDYDRNYVRNNILQHLKKLRPNYQQAFHKLSEHAIEQLELNESFLKSSKCNHYTIDKETKSSELFHVLIQKEKSLLGVVTKNCIDNILYEVELMYKKKIIKKEIKISSGWGIQLVKNNENIEIDVFREKI
ncbi:tRNA lysidine(34) synthetase TilS [Fluviispira multicolorata]|uniref:tRNA(Ile)-lysidine synthase n=1 Tax=Fluviispira multicolorata TaxID=2654512 RepID=A0A833JCK2_9BACT|nr:tRNA lysidine(34) synthetase TilS [Fluviispira multicolorata]KAB8030753.1 tRNA lysidine(34) synthetase TilS [Fluviispira multicolorata]